MRPVPGRTQKVRKTARSHRCGIQTAWTEASDARGAVRDLGAAIDGRALGQLIVLFSPEYEAEALAAALADTFPGVPTTGCSTSGGISPAGAIERGIVVVAFPRDGFRIATTCLADIGVLDVEARRDDDPRASTRPRPALPRPYPRPSVRLDADRRARERRGDGRLDHRLGPSTASRWSAARPATTCAFATRS